MKDIKERVIKKDVRLLEKTVQGADKTVRTIDRGKEVINESSASRYGSANEYAQDKMGRTAENVAHKGIKAADKAGRKAVRSVGEQIKGHRAGKAIKDSPDGSPPENHQEPRSNTPLNEPAGFGAPEGINRNGPQERPRGAARQNNQRQQSRVKTKERYQPKGQGRFTEVNSPSATNNKAPQAPKGREHIRGKPNAQGAPDKRAHIRGKTTDVGKRAAENGGQVAKKAGKGSVKTAGKAAKHTVKSGEKTTKLVARSAKATAKTATKTAQAAAKAAQQAVKAFQQTAKAVAHGIKLAIKATIAAVKAIIAATKALVTAIAAGGWIAVVIILVISLAGILISSPFGLFYSADASSPESTTTTITVVQQTALEFNTHIQDILNAHDFDELDIQYINHGHHRVDNWIDVLAVYAVRTANREDGMEVVTIDEARAEIISSIFWDMHTTDYWLETVEHREIVTGTDEWGYEYEYEEITHTYILHVTIEGKSAWEQADAYSLNAEQREFLMEMLLPDYTELYVPLIGNPSMISDGRGAVGTGMYIWPSAVSDTVTSPYGSRVHPVTGEWDFHLGIDISAGNGTPVLAADGGTVTVATEHWSYGNYVVIDHGNGNSTLYAHMNSYMVSVGDSVSQGQQIGAVGSTGVSTSNHIHFETHTSSGRVDPLEYFENYTTAW